MCGISGFLLRDPSFRVDRDALLTTLLDEIEMRGTHATGYVAIGGDGTLDWQKASCKASVFNLNRRRVPDSAQVVLGHTRWATQGLPSFMENNHPIKRGSFYVIHNGHVSNDTKLFANAERRPFGEVDSEAIVARLSSFGDLKFLGNVMEEIDGDAAVAAVDERDGSRLVLARGHSSPLWIYNGRRIVVFASTITAVTEAYEKHIGRIGEARLIEAEEGEMFVWKGQTEFWKQELDLPKRWKITKWSGTSWGDDWHRKDTDGIWSPRGSYKKWDPDQKKYVEAERNEKKEEDAVLERAAAELVGGHTSDYDFVGCDGCDEVVTYLEIEYIYDHKSGTTLLFCDKCYTTLHEDVDDDDVEIVDDEKEDSLQTSLITFGPYDDYAGANAAVLRQSESRSLVDRIAGGLFFRGF